MCFYLEIWLCIYYLLKISEMKYRGQSNIKLSAYVVLLFVECDLASLSIPIARLISPVVWST